MSLNHHSQLKARSHKSLAPCENYTRCPALLQSCTSRACSHNFRKCIMQSHANTLGPSTSFTNKRCVQRAFIAHQRNLKAPPTPSHIAPSQLQMANDEQRTANGERRTANGDSDAFRSNSARTVSSNARCRRFRARGNRSLPVPCAPAGRQTPTSPTYLPLLHIFTTREPQPRPQGLHRHIRCLPRTPNVEWSVCTSG